MELPLENTQVFTSTKEKKNSMRRIDGFSRSRGNAPLPEVARAIKRKGRRLTEPKKKRTKKGETEKNQEARLYEILLNQSACCKRQLEGGCFASRFKNNETIDYPKAVEAFKSVIHQTDTFSAEKRSNILREKFLSVTKFDENTKKWKRNDVYKLINTIIYHIPIFLINNYQSYRNANLKSPDNLVKYV